MKKIFLVTILSFVFNAQASTLEAKLLIHEQNSDHIEKINDVSRISSAMKISLSKPSVYVHLYLWGLEKNAEGGFGYMYDIEGVHRHNKNIPKKMSGGSVRTRDDIELMSTPALGIYNKEDEGLWDIKVTVTDLVSGEVIVKELRGVEVIK